MRRITFFGQHEACEIALAPTCLFCFVCCFCFCMSNAHVGSLETMSSCDILSYHKGTIYFSSSFLMVISSSLLYIES